MEETLTLETQDTETRSARKWNKKQRLIEEASGNGRCWWIKQYLRAVL
tara:strand:- start:379 stop:522 length:144 start_codon:yes stop_codon:yes gene_type:complete